MVHVPAFPGDSIPTLSWRRCDLASQSVVRLPRTDQRRRDPARALAVHERGNVSANRAPRGIAATRRSPAATIGRAVPARARASALWRGRLGRFTATGRSGASPAHGQLVDDAAAVSDAKTLCGGIGTNGTETARRRR